jgi:hypothetical protein
MTQVGVEGSGGFEVQGLKREHWSNANPIRAIFRQAFSAAGLPYFNPHSFRDTLVRLGEKVCRNPEEFKAWSQNLGHEKVLTTFTSYGNVSSHRQAEIFTAMRNMSNINPFVGRSNEQAVKNALAVLQLAISPVR